MTNSFFKKMCLAATVPFCLSASVVHAANMETLTIKQQTSHYMNMNQQIKTIAIGDPSIASIVQLPGSASEFLIITKAVKGSTALFVWTIDGARHEYNVVVSPEDPDQAMVIEKAIGLPNVHVKMVGEKILLTGTVENQYEKNYALQTARLYVNGSTESSLLVGSGFDMELDVQESTSSSSDDVKPTTSESKGNIIDLIQILHPTQIRLEAQIIEISSDDAKELGIQYGTMLSGDTTPRTDSIFYFGENFNRAEEPIHFKNNPVRWFGQHFSPINATIQALVTKGKAKILSRPSVMTLSGEQATIQIGGEIPYEISTSSSSSVEIINYGIILQFKPVVDAQGRINSAIHAEVSNLGGTTTADGRMIILTRRADSVISINSGSSIVIGGLMDSSESKTVSKIPLLGDIPIIGEFFKHTSRTRDKRELIIVVTPHIVGVEDRSRAPMSDAMRKWYEQERLYREAMRDFDFNDSRIKPPPSDALNSGEETNKPFSK